MKKRVHYAELEDMQKYIEGFNPDDYESCGERTDPSVIAYARDYYDKHLPVDVTAWIRVNEPDENLIYAKGLGDQVCFVRDRLCQLLRSTYEEWRDNPPLVISTHYSKSVKLPVFQINLEKYGIEMVLRYNFYDWKISVKSDKPRISITWDFLIPQKRFHIFTARDFRETRFMAAMSRVTPSSLLKSALITTCTLSFSYSRTTWELKEKIKMYLFRHHYCYLIVVAVSFLFNFKNYIILILLNKYNAT